MDTINTEFIEKNVSILNQYNITFADAAIECLYSIIDPEAPEIAEVAKKFAENREITFKNDTETDQFVATWENLNAPFAAHLNTLKQDDAAFTTACKTVATSITTAAFNQSKGGGLCELIIGSMDLIVFIYNRYYELKSMIRELFQYEGDDAENEFIKIIESTCLQFSEDCGKEDEASVKEAYFERVALFFSQAILLCGIALLSRKHREGTTQ